MEKNIQDQGKLHHHDELFNMSYAKLSEKEQEEIERIENYINARKTDPVYLLAFDKDLEK